MDLISYLTLGFSILVTITNIVVLITIKFNDLAHLQKDVTEIKQNVNHLYEKVNGLCQRVSNIEGKLSK